MGVGVPPCPTTCTCSALPILLCPACLHTRSPKPRKGKAQPQGTDCTCLLLLLLNAMVCCRVPPGSTRACWHTASWYVGIAMHGPSAGGPAVEVLCGRACASCALGWGWPACHARTRHGRAALGGCALRPAPRVHPPCLPWPTAPSPRSFPSQAAGCSMFVNLLLSSALWRGSTLHSAAFTTPQQYTLVDTLPVSRRCGIMNWAKGPGGYTCSMSGTVRTCTAARHSGHWLQQWCSSAARRHGWVGPRDRGAGDGTTM